MIGEYYFRDGKEGFSDRVTFEQRLEEKVVTS